MKPDAPSFPCGEHAAMCSRAAGLYSEKLEIETGEGATNVDCGLRVNLSHIKCPTQIVNRVVPSISSVRPIIAGGSWPSGRVPHHILNLFVEEVIKCG
jgi:hypothetical protein